jgi:hypothetical protein
MLMPRDGRKYFVKIDGNAVVLTRKVTTIAAILNIAAEYYM